IRGPFHHALRGRHEGEATLRFLTKEAEIRGWIPDAEHAQAMQIGPAHADAAADEATRHHPEHLAIEIAQIDDVERHGGKTLGSDGSPTVICMWHAASLRRGAKPC